MGAVTLLSVFMSCGAPVADNKTKDTNDNGLPILGTYYDTKLNFVSDNKAVILGLDDPNKTYVTMRIYSSLKSKFGERVICAGGDGEPIVLINNPMAQPTSLDRVSLFIQYDDTDSMPYVEGKFICADYAKRVHDNAEGFGIKCGVVTLIIVDKSGNYRSHTWNYFPIEGTTGGIYIDCTNSNNVGGFYGDALVVYDNESKTYYKSGFFRDGKEINEDEYNNYRVIESGLTW